MNVLFFDNGRSFVFARCRKSPKQLSVDGFINLAASIKKGCPLDRQFIADELTGQSYVPIEAVPALFDLLTNENDLDLYTLDTVLEVSHGNDHFFSMIQNLDDYVWKRLWLSWTEQEVYSDLCCYELEGRLHLWRKGTLHSICDDSSRTKQMLQVVLETGIRSSDRE